MANIGKLAVFISANATKLYSGLAGAAQRIKQFSTSAAGSLKGAFAAFLGPAGSLAALPAFGSLLTGIPDKFRELADAMKAVSMDAARFGMPAEQLQGLQYAAERSGIEVEQLNKALFHLQRHEGGDAMEGLLKAADEFNSMDVGNRAAFAFDKFAKSGFAMMSLLGRGREGIKDLMAQGAATGNVLSGIDIAKLVEAKAAMGKLKLMFAGLQNQILVAIAPAVISLANIFGKTLAPAIQLVGGLFARWFQLWSGLISRVADLIGGLLSQFMQGIGLAGGMASVFSYLDDALDAFFQIVDALMPLVVALGEEGIANLLDWGKQLLDWLGLTGIEFPSAQEAAVAFFRGIGLAGAYAFDGIVTGVGYVGLALGKMMQWLGQSLTAFANWAQEWTKIGLEFRRGVIAKMYDGLVTLSKPIVVLGGLLVGLWRYAIRPTIQQMENMFKLVAENLGAIIDLMADLAAALGRALPTEIRLGINSAKGAFDTWRAAVKRAGRDADNPMTQMFDAFQTKQDEVLRDAAAFGDRLGEMGKDVEAWGRARIDAFGQGADRVNAFFDNLQLRQRQLDQLAQGPLAAMAGADYHANAAIVKGSKEDVSIRARFGFEGARENAQLEVQKKQLEVQQKLLFEAQRQSDYLRWQADVLRDGEPVLIFP